MRRPAIDVSHLPEYALGPRNTIWWGVVCLLAIESSMFVLLWATYLYLRGNESQWPPMGLTPAVLRLAAVQVGLLAVSCVPMHLACRAALKQSLRGMRWGLALATLVAVGALAVRWAELQALPFRWDSNAHGSVFWTLLGLHTFHVVAASGENLAFIAVLLVGPVEKERLEDLRANAMYWYAVALGWWLPTFALMYLDPAVLRAA